MSEQVTKPWVDFVDDLSSILSIIGSEKIPTNRGSVDINNLRDYITFSFGYVTVGPAGSGAMYECDGTADDVQIQAAWDYLMDGGGGTLKVLPGEYHISTTIYMNGSDFIVSGSGQATKFILDDEVNSPIIESGDATNAYFNRHFFDFYMDGNKTNQTAESLPPGGERVLLRLRDDAQTSYYATVERVYAYNGKHNGISVESTNYATVRNCRAKGMDNYGIWFENGSNINITDNYAEENVLGGIKGYASSGCTVKGNICKRNKGAGLLLQSVGFSTVSNNVAWRSGWQSPSANVAADGFSLSTCTGTTFSGNTSFGSYGNGMTMVECTGCTINENSFSRNGQQTNNTYSDILLDQSSTDRNTNNSFNGNTFNNETVTNYSNKVAYNIKANATGHVDNTFNGNNFGNPGTSKVSLLASTSGSEGALDNHFINNKGLNPVGYYNYGTFGTNDSVNPEDGDFLRGQLVVTPQTNLSIENGLFRGQRVTVALDQGDGSKLVNWDDDIVWVGGSEPTLSTTAGAVDTFEFIWSNTGSGGYWQEVYRNIADLPSKNIVKVGGSEYHPDYDVADFDGFSEAVQQAVDDVSTAGGGVVEILPGTFTRTARITTKSNVRIKGSGEDATTILSNTNSDYIFYNSSAVSNVTIEDMTIDMDDKANASGIRIQNATNSKVNRVKFLNGGSGGWFMVLGTPDSVNDDVTNFDNTIEDCTFDTHAGSLEMLLIFNAKNTHIIRPRFTNKTTSGPTLGLWQKCYGTRIVDPQFIDNPASSCIYYSITTDDTWIIRPRFENCGAGIRGANVSDNGTFGEVQAKKLVIEKPVYIGGANSADVVAIQVGAVDRMLIDGPFIRGADVGINIDSGTSVGNPYRATNWVIRDPDISNCNQSDDSYTLHPGIKFSSIGGAMYGKIIGGNVYDTQATKTQRNCIVFTGAYTWSDIVIENTRLEADTANSGVPILLDSSAALGTNIQIRNNPGLNPDYVYAQGNVTGATTFNRTSGRTITATLTGSVTATITDGFIKGDRLTLVLTQGGSGSYTFTKPSNMKVVGGTFTLSTAVGSVDAIELEWDGTNWYELSRSIGIA